MYPHINVYDETSGDPNRERNTFFDDKDYLNVFREGMQYRGHNVSLASLHSMSENNMMMHSEWNMMSRNKEGMSVSRTQ